MGGVNDGLWAPERRALTTGLVLTITFIASEALAVVTIMPVVAREMKLVCEENLAAAAGLSAPAVLSSLFARCSQIPQVVPNLTDMKSDR